ncbi:SDR family oxidoreductase [Microbacterium sp. NPDC055357]
MDLSSPSGRERHLRAPDGRTPPPLVLVLGATGYIGGRLVPRLLNAGYRVRVLARSRERALAFPWGADVEVIEGAAQDRPAVSRAMRGADVAFHLVHSLGAGRDFEETDRVIARTVATAAAEEGVGQLVYLGGLHPAADLSPHLRSRVEVGEILRASGVPTLVLQAGTVIGSGSASFEMVRHLTDVLPYMPAPRWVRNRIQPIAVRDVLHYLLSAARLPTPVSGQFDIGGPDVLRYGQMMNGYAVEAGLPQRAIAALPVLTPRLASHWVNLVTPIPRALARPLVESLQNDCVMADHRIDAVIPPPEGGLTPYRQAVRLALRRLGEDGVETSWQDAGVLTAPGDLLPSDPERAGRTAHLDERSATSSAPVDSLWRVISGIGGANGWYSSPVLWALRGWLDKLVGGVGLARGRRSQSRLQVGDALDFWRVEAVEHGSLLRLRAEMRVPGEAWLEMRASAEDDGSRYRQRAIFFPRGLAGRVYWLAVLPFHGVIFRGMANHITAAAEADTTPRRGAREGTP